MDDIKKTITIEGVRLTHPSGVITLLTLEKMEELHQHLIREKERIEKNIKRLDDDMAAVKEVKEAEM